ncbi:Hypothetical protein A7982_04367 [Minicystis rosea]|nr:Hypothetical protein A7982_04367 [Minicystis rosea]
MSEPVVERYSASESSITGLFLLVLGLFLTVLPVAATVDNLCDLRAFPDAPRDITVAEAAAMREPPRGAWVRLVDARIECRHPPRRGGSGPDVYALLTDATDGPRVLVSVPGPGQASCENPAKVPNIGVLKAGTPGRIVGLGWPGLDWNQWPTPHLTMLWTDAGPSDSRLWVWLGPLFTLPGLLLLAIGKRSLRDGLRARRAPPPVLTDATFAMPLSTGASALQLFGGGLVVLQLVVFGPLFFLKHLPEWMAIPLGILAALWFFAILGMLIDGWKRRASDLLLGRDAIAVRGGPLHRTRHAFRDPPSFTLERHEANRDGDIATLRIGGEVAAICRDEDEASSLGALVSTVEALHAQAVGEQRPRTGERPPGVVSCGACGAPVAPSAEPETTCGHCGAKVVMPEATRAEIAAQGDLAAARAESERLLRRLLRQPGAHRTNLLMLFAIPPAILGWPVAGVLFDEFYQARHLFSWHHGVSLFVAALTFTYGLSWLLRAQIVGRAAVRLVATRFAAVPPASAGEPSSCHCCGGPLPDAAEDRLVVVCVYCRSANVLGTHLVPVARREQGQARDLTAALRERLAERRRYFLISMGSLVLLAISAASLAPVWRVLRGG